MENPIGGAALRQPLDLPADVDWKRFNVMLAVPYDRSITGPFFQSICRTLTCPFLKISPFVAPGAVIHLSRDAMIRAAINDKNVTHLCMVDSDQTFGSLVLPRLVAWDVPVVAPVIVQRAGDPVPVAYREVAKDDRGFWRYEPLTAPIAAYLSQFREEWWHSPAATSVLPLQPEQLPQMEGMPDSVLDGLGQPLLPVDAVGTGMIVIRRDVLEALEPDPKTGLYTSFQEGGEDFELSRRIRAAGWGGMGKPGPRGHGVYLDRGCHVGHMTFYARGVGDMLSWLQEQAYQAVQKEAQEQEQELPPAAELAEQLRTEREAVLV